MSGSSAWIRVASTADVGDGEAYAIETGGRHLAIYHVGDAWYCTDNICTHAFALLTDGWFEGHLIECPLHAGQFDVRNGKGCGSPIEKDLDTFPIKIDGDDVLVDLTAPASA